MPAYQTILKNRFFDSNGVQLIGGMLFTYAAGTTTPKTTFTDSSGVTPNANPVVLDSYGQADVFLDSGFYKFVLKDASGVTQWTEDNISLPGGAVSSIPVAGSANQILSKIDSTNYNTQWVDQLTVTGTSAAPRAITAAGGVGFTGSTFRNIWYVESNSGAVTVTATPQIAAGTIEGQELKLVQMDATKTLQFSDGNGLALSGNSTLILDQIRKMAVFHWDSQGAVWVEQSRS